MILLASILALLTLTGLSIFQLLLITGTPWGNYAWGGQHTVLPKKLRIASIFSIVLYIIFSLFLITKAGLLTVIPDAQVVEVGMWIITAYFFLGIFMNKISKSKKERALMTPIALLLAITFLLVAL